jgi:hypothetical protein
MCTQVTAFVALLALDARRIEQRRCDLAPCVVLPKEEDEDGRQSAPAEGGPWAEERSVSAVLHRYMTQVVHLAYGSLHYTGGAVSYGWG